MYEDRREKFSFKSFFLTLLLVLLFVFLMLWLFPTKKYIDGLSTESYDLDRISILYDEIFYNNIIRMKEAAIGYYTNERMPQTVGQSKKMTLQEMYDLHLVLKMKAKDGKACNTESSYVEMTKFTEEYRLKVNLSCGSDEDYIIVYLGCYSYCPGGVCEKQVSTPSKVTAEEEKKYIKTEEKYTCKVVNGTYYDASGKKVSKTEYEKSCTKPEEKYTCKVVNGTYYDASGKKVSKTEYEKSCTKPEEKYTCKVVNGTYYDASGNKVSKAEYEKSCNPVVKKYQYEYKKVIADKTTCTAWSSWTKTAIAATSTVQVETKTEKEITSYKTELVQTGTKTQKVSTKEKYVDHYITELVYTGTKQVQVGTTTKTTTKEVQVGTVEKYSGTGSGTTVPSNTSTTRYEVIGSTTQASCSNCSEKTVYTWKIWKKEPVYEVKTVTEKVPVYKTIDVYEEKQTPVYSYKTVTKEVKVPVYEEVKTPQYSNVKYYRSKTCTVVKGSTSIKWSYSNKDTELLNDGYLLTGNVKEI